ncbi:ATP-binding cassette sub- D member 4 [Apophysomyces sp. BC1015]|nr:ATP-binding cassette sub- D member 4 [Apophysomyces sp. BC1015]
MRERLGSTSSLDPILELSAPQQQEHPSPPPALASEVYSFDYVFVKRAYRLIRLLFRPSRRFWLASKDVRQGSLFWLYVTFVCLSCLKEILVYFVGLIPSRFFALLTSKDSAGFLHFLFPCLLLVFGTAAGNSLLSFMGGLFALKTRRLLTEHLQDRYVRPKTMYTLIINHESIDNPDQRITQDIDKFADALREIVEKLIIAPILIGYYTWQCWTVGGFVGPLMIYGYFVLGSWISRRFIQPIVSAVFYKELQEGNFRDGEREENVRARNSLNTLLTYQRTIINKELPLRLANQSFQYLGSILSYLIVAIPIFTGVYDDKDASQLSEIISKNAFVSMYLIYQFTTIIEQSTQFSDLAGYTARVAELLEAMDEVDNEIENIEIDYPCHREDDQSETIEFETVSLISPRGKPIVIDFDLKVNRGEHIMIMGPNASGKTSLLRALAGLWPCSKGRIHVPKTSGRGQGIVFLPQTPYLIQGSLRDQIGYPGIASTNCISDQEVRQLLAQVQLTHLEYLVDSFDTPYSQEWNKMLSPGEQQKLIFARLFYLRPHFAALDEATSAMDSEAGIHLYHQARQLDITLISVSHQPSVIPFHTQLVKLDGLGGYTIQPVATS